MYWGLCCTPAQGEIAAAAGYDFIELHVQRDLVPEKPEADFAPLLAAIAASPCPARAANCFIPGHLKIVGPTVDFPRLSAYVETALRRAAAAGLQTIVFGSGGARQIPEGWDRGTALRQLIAFGRMVGEVAARYGVAVVVEPLNRGECNVLNGTGESADYVKLVDRSHFRLLVDAWHWHRENEGPADITAHGPLFAHTHIATLGKRAMPGSEPSDFRPFLGALRQIGYGGRCAVEAMGTDLPAQAAPALAALREAWASL